MQKTNQPAQETDKNKGDQSAVEQQKKETMKNPSPESSSSNAGNESMTAQDHDRMEDRSKGMTGQGAGSQSNPGMSGSQSGQGLSGRQSSQGGRDQGPVNQSQTGKGQRQYESTNQDTEAGQDDTSRDRSQGNTMGSSGQQQKGSMDSSNQGQSKNQGK